jgi:hypothetical protein
VEKGKWKLGRGEVRWEAIRRGEWRFEIQNPHALKTEGATREDFDGVGLTLAGAGAILGHDGGVVGHFLRRE